MRLAQQIALTTSWWVWPDTAIHEALAKVKLRHWLAVVRATLKHNQKHGRRPAQMTELHRECYLNRHRGHVPKLIEGQYNLTDPLLVGMACALKIAVHDLVPDEVTWLAGVTQVLAGEGVPATEAQAFAYYCCRRPVPEHAVAHAELDWPTVRLTFKDAGQSFRGIDDAEHAILSAAEILGDRLKEMRSCRESLTTS